MRPDNHYYDDRKYESWVRKRPCLVKGCSAKAVVHHVWHAGGEKCRNSYCSVPLCVEHHTAGKFSYHHLEFKRFEDHHSIDLSWELINLLSEYVYELKQAERPERSI